MQSALSVQEKVLLYWSSSIKHYDNESFFQSIKSNKGGEGLYPGGRGGRVITGGDFLLPD